VILVVLVDGKDSENYLEFKLNLELSLDLMSTRLAYDNSNAIETFILNNHSMIGFLAAVSLKLENKTIEIVDKN
jgi:hypothetical protein